MMLRTNVRVFTKYWKKKKTNFRKYLKKHHLHVHILKLVQRPDFQRGKVVDLIGIDRANSGFRLEWKARRWNRISRGRPSRNTIHFESWGHDAIMHKCLCIYASEKTRIGSTGARRHGFSDPPLPPSKIAKAKNDPREANKLWSEKFSWIGEREREEWYKEEYGVRRWRGANEFSMPFPYPHFDDRCILESVWCLRIFTGFNYLFVARFSSSSLSKYRFDSFFFY